MIEYSNAWIKKGMGLDYLRPIIKRTLEHCEECRNALTDESITLEKTLPTAGKEISLVPLLLASCYENNHLASMEVSVDREGSNNQGKLDLIIYSKSSKAKFDGTLIEVKASMRSIISATLTSRVEEKMDLALKQLKSIYMEEFDKIGSFERVGIVIMRLGLSEQEHAKYNEEKKEQYCQEIEKTFSNLKSSYDGLAYHILKPHYVTVKKGSKPYFTNGLLIAVKKLTIT